MREGRPRGVTLPTFAPPLLPPPPAPKTPHHLLRSSYPLRKAERQRGDILAKQKGRDGDEKWGSQQHQGQSRREG